MSTIEDLTTHTKLIWLFFLHFSHQPLPEHCCILWHVKCNRQTSGLVWHNTGRQTKLTEKKTAPLIHRLPWPCGPTCEDLMHIFNSSHSSHCIFQIQYHKYFLLFQYKDKIPTYPHHVKAYNNNGDSSSYISDDSDGWLLLRHHHWKTLGKKIFRTGRSPPQLKPISGKFLKPGKVKTDLLRRDFIKNLQTSCKTARLSTSIHLPHHQPN